MRQHSQKATWSARKALVLVSCTGHENKGAPDYVAWTSWRRSMSGSLEQLAGLEDEEEEGEESGSSVHCSENCLREY